MKRIKNLAGKSNAFLGLLTTLCGLVMMWVSSIGSSSTQSGMESALNQAIDIDASQPSADYNGRLVVAAGQLRGEGTLEDEFLKPQSALVLKRFVEMYQWVERQPDASRGSLQPEIPVEPSYELDWVQGEVDFFRFKVTTGHENPVLKIASELKKASNPRFSGFDGAKVVDAVEKLAPLVIDTEMLKDPTLRIENNRIVIKRDPSTVGPALGDMRVWYEVLPEGDYTVMTRQADEMTLLGSGSARELVVQPGRLTAADLIESVGSTAKEAYNGMLYLGAVLLSIGLVSVLSPYADRIDLRPKIDLQGMPAVVLLSVGISAALTGVFMVLALLG